MTTHSATLEVAFPNGVTDGIMKWRTFSCVSCDPTSALGELMDTGEFQTWFHSNEIVATSCADCPDPQPYNDPLINGLDSIGVLADTSFNGYFPATNSTWQLSSIGADCAWSMTDNSLDPFRIAVVDSEIDLTHPDLIGRVREVYRESGYNGWHPHGTNVSSIIVSGINDGIGTAGACDICEVDMFTILPDSPGYTEGIVEAANRGYKVINASCRWPDYAAQLFIDAMEAVSNAGAVLVTGAAGNNQNSIANDFPETESFPGIIIQAGSYYNNSRDQVGHFYDFQDGPTIDILSPSINIWRAQSRSLNPVPYGIGNGGSLGIPLVATAAAMLLHSYPCLSAAEVESLIEEGANSECLIWHDPNIHGAGHLNIPQSLTLAGDRIEANQDPVVISNQQTIADETVYYNNNLIVTEGGSLTVTNSILRFAEGYGLIVEEDGNLTALGSTFENNPCSGKYWSGISTDGNAFITGAVNTAPSATLVGSTVRNAKTGVQDYGQTTRSHSGGAISVSTSIFENCQTAISSSNSDFAPVISSNDIRVDDDYPHAILEHVGVKLTYGDVGQVAVLSSNTFEDSRTDKEAGGTAIYVVDASFSVVDETVITGYLHGVKAFQGRIDNHLATVRDCESFNTAVSTWIIGYNNPQVINNTFEAQSADVYNDRFGAPIPVQGIRMELCRRHVVEGNVVNGTTTASDDTYGIVIIGCLVSTTRDAVYNNTLNECNYGMWSEGINSGVDNIEGLCYECNSFNGCERDVDSEEDATIAFYQQGVENDNVESAGNVFGSDLMQFASRGNDVFYFRVNLNEEPDPRFRVTPSTTFLANDCLPIFGFTGGGDPPCEDIDIIALDTDRQIIEDYYQGGNTSEEQALIALSEYNRQYVMFAREYIDQVDDCGNGSVVEWENTIKTAAPWEPLDETLVDVYQGDFVSARTAIQGLVGLISQTEVSRLSTILTLSEDVQASNTDDEVEAAFTNANLTAFLSESELNQSYSQGLARAAASSYGLSSYEARLSEAVTDDKVKDDDVKSLVLPTPFELQNVAIFDALGRQVGNTNQGGYLTIESLNHFLSAQPSGIYYVRGVDSQGLIQTLSISNAR